MLEAVPLTDRGAGAGQPRANVRACLNTCGVFSVGVGDYVRRVVRKAILSAAESQVRPGYAYLHSSTSDCSL